MNAQVIPMPMPVWGSCAAHHQDQPWVQAAVLIVLLAQLVGLLWIWWTR